LSRTACALNRTEFLVDPAGNLQSMRRADGSANARSADSLKRRAQDLRISPPSIKLIDGSIVCECARFSRTALPGMARTTAARPAAGLPFELYGVLDPDGPNMEAVCSPESQRAFFES
jgi:hypothetical protein